MSDIDADDLFAEYQALFATPVYRWECNLDECDGTPHGEWTYSHARTKQRLPKGAWFIWLLLLGRGWGKSRTGSECFLDLILANPKTADGKNTNWLIAGPTFADTRDVCVEGPSGLLDALEERGLTEDKGDFIYNRSLNTIKLKTGQKIFLRGGDQENLGRGLNLAGAWVDEFGMWKRALAAWSEALTKALRQKLPGTAKNRVIVTTTPKVQRGDALKLMKAWKARTDGSAIVTTGSTFENAHNLSTEYMEELLRDSPEGTRVYRQEVLGEITDEIEGALWTLLNLEDNRYPMLPDETLSGVLKRIDPYRTIVSVDPAGTSGPHADETGIVGTAHTRDGHHYVVADRSGKYPPAGWARAALQMCIDIRAGTLVIETSGAGSDSLIRNLQVEAKAMHDEGLLQHAPIIQDLKATGKTGGKNQRAEPVANMYIQNLVHHVGPLPQLEDQLVTWSQKSGYSPDRLDAMVWALWVATDRVEKPKTGLRRTR